MSGQQKRSALSRAQPRKDGKTYESAAIARGAAASGGSPEHQDGGCPTGGGAAAAPRDTRARPAPWRSDARRSAVAGCTASASMARLDADAVEAKRSTPIGIVTNPHAMGVRHGERARPGRERRREMKVYRNVVMLPLIVALPLAGCA